jgi:hypothetical protein
METTFRTTFSMQACHSAVSAMPGSILVSSISISSSSYIVLTSGVFCPADSFPLIARCCFWGRSFTELGCCFRFARTVPFVPFMVEVWSWLTDVVLTRRTLEGFVKETVEEWCFSSRETILGDGNAIADARLAGFVDATA